MSEPIAMAPRSDSLERLRRDITSCQQCPRLVQWCRQVAITKRASYADEQYWGRPVPGFGDPAASVLIVGLAPAAHGANRTGRMFTGDRSGDWLFRALHRAGLATSPVSSSRDDGTELVDAYLCSAVRCAPPDNRPLPEEAEHCRPFLARELALLGNARVLVCLGGFALDAVARHYGLRPRPRFGHLVEVPLPDSLTALCSYHPSQQNTFTGRLTEPMLDAVFTRARQLAGLPAVS